MTENLTLWNAASKTDPAFTKPFQRGGGFKGTATNATYLARKATEQFGPCGIGWGVNVLDERILDGSEGVKVHRVHIRLWYMLDGKRGEIEHFGQTEFCGKRSNGNPYTDEEAPKKSLTDAMTKALSLLGFAADVHLGLYDDNKYVASLKAEFAEEKKQQAEEKAEAPPPRTVYDVETGGQVEAKPANVTTLPKREERKPADDFPGNEYLDRQAIIKDLRQQIDGKATINAVTDLMLQEDTQRDLNQLPQQDRDALRDYAKARLIALGWPSKKAQ